MKKVVKRLKSPTPLIVKGLQALSVALAAIPTYYGTLPADFQQTLPKNMLMYVSIAGIVIVFLLQLINKKDATN